MRFNDKPHSLAVIVHGMKAAFRVLRQGSHALEAEKGKKEKKSVWKLFTPRHRWWSWWSRKVEVMRFLGIKWDQLIGEKDIL